ncbi:MAG: signal peptidase I [Lachnospiraceae bacterium]|nr:signal peptidase I [Lachnospiraceae bacterium]
MMMDANNKPLKKIIPAVIVGLLVYVVIVFLFHPYIICGPSMEPSFVDGDLIFTDRAEDIQVGDVIVAKTNVVHTIIKRVIALPGDTVDIIGGKIYVNGEALDIESIDNPGELKYPYIVPADCYFLLGDNVNSSMDSRTIGAVGAEFIKYKYRTTIIHG